VMEEGQPNPLFLMLSGGAFAGDPVTHSAEIEYPAETSLLYDGLLSAPGGAWGFADVMIDGRHSGAAHVAWGDGHVKAAKARPSGQPCTGMDGKPSTQYIATEAGPYQGHHTLAGIPVRNANGSWGLK
jgi:prepilin-type processing-associated H-X9-DG protein